MSAKNKENQQQIVIEYRHPGNPPRLRFPTSFKVDAKTWNKELGISLTDEPLNTFLKTEKEKLEKVKIDLLNQGIEPTCVNFKKALEDIKEAASNKKKNSTDEEDILNRKFVKWYEVHLEQIESANTRKSEKNVYNYVLKYDKNATLNDIDIDWLEGFYKYLSKNLDKISTIESYMSRLGRVFNTIRKYARRSRKIKLLIAEIKEEIKDIKPDVVYDEPIGLDYQMFLDLIKFDRFDIKQKHLEVTRDHFVLMVCMGGLRVHDYLAINPDDIRKENILIDGEEKEVWLFDYFENKNGRHHKDIPILPWGVDIIKKYGGRLPYKKDGVKELSKDINLDLKDLAELLGWTHEIEIKFFGPDRKVKKIEKKRFCDHISSKMARQTRVSIDDEAQIEENISRAATGHKSAARKRYQYKSVAAMVKGNQKHIEEYQKQKSK